MRFAIEVDDDWLDTLDALAGLVAAQGGGSQESALEQTIFAQISNQRKERNQNNGRDMCPVR